MLGQVPQEYASAFTLTDSGLTAPSLMRAGTPSAMAPAGTSVPGGTTAPAPTREPERQTTPSRTTAPEPTSTRSSRRQPSRCARCPITQSSPIRVCLLELGVDDGTVLDRRPGADDDRAVVGPDHDPRPDAGARPEADFADQDRLGVDVGIRMDPWPFVAQRIESHGAHSNSEDASAVTPALVGKQRARTASRPAGVQPSASSEPSALTATWIGVRPRAPVG